MPAYKTTELPAIDAVAAADLIALVDDVGGTPVTKSATVSQLAAAILPIIYPVGSRVVMDLDPATVWGFGTWAEYGQGQATVGLDVTDPDFDTIGKTGGVKTVTLAEAEIPVHGHAVNDPGHSHVIPAFPQTTGANSGFTRDTSMNGTLVDTTLNTRPAVTGITLDAAGGGQPHTNMPPYFVERRWLRTA